MHLGSIYLVVNDFEKSISFYEKILEMPVAFRNMNRFAGFELDKCCISIMNGHFDVENPDKVIHKGNRSITSIKTLQERAIAPNTQKFVLNFWHEDLRAEYERIKRLNITNFLSEIKYVCNVNHYYYFDFIDPDGNIIEVTGNYTPEIGEFNE